MSQPTLPHAENVATRLAGELETWATSEKQRAVPGAVLVGPQGSGKSFVLDRLRRTAATTGIPTLFVAPPTWGLDGPAHLVAQAAGCLRERGSNGLLNDVYRAEVGFAQKVDVVLSDLKSVGRCILLLDVPDRWWSPAEDGPDEAETYRIGTAAVQKLIGGATSLGAAVYVSAGGAAPSGVPTLLRQEALDRRSAGAALLSDGDSWGVSANLAAALGQRLGDDANHMTPLDLRLAVALRHLQGNEEQVVEASYRGLRALVRAFTEEVKRRPGLRHGLAVLARLRFPVSDDVLRALVGTVGPDEQRVLDMLILREPTGAGALHPEVAASFLGALATDDKARDDEKRIHALLESGRAAETPASVSSRDAAIAWFERVHHAALAGDRSSVGESPPDASLLRALGKTLSIQRRFSEAVEVYDRAARLQPDDAYSVEYLGFNLERLGRKRDRALECFQKAVELDPENPWWNRRYVQSLIRRGLIREAVAACNVALGRLTPAVYGQNLRWLARNFHVGVARSFLDRACLDEACAVLESVPAEDRNQEAVELLDCIQHRREARRLGVALFPETIPFDQRWARPQLDDAGMLDDGGRWYPGRIEALDDAGVVLVLGRHAHGETEIFQVELATDEFLEAANLRSLRTVRVGQFVELLVSKTGEQQLLIRPTPRDARRAPPPDSLAGFVDELDG